MSNPKPKWTPGQIEGVPFEEQISPLPWSAGTAVRNDGQLSQPFYYVSVPNWEYACEAVNAIGPVKDPTSELARLMEVERVAKRMFDAMEVVVAERNTSAMALNLIPEVQAANYKFFAEVHSDAQKVLKGEG